MDDRLNRPGVGAGDGGALARQLLSDDALAAVLAHPDFPTTALEVMAAWAPHTDDDRALAGLVRDLGQYMCAIWAVQLDASPEGLTHSSLSRLLAPFGMVNKTRVHAILTYLRFTRLIRPKASLDGRQKAYEPTPTLLRLFKARLERELRICCKLSPAAGAALARWDEPGVVEATLSAHGRLFGSALERRFAEGDAGDSLDVFSNRSGGLTVIGQLVLQACPDGRFPPKGPVLPNASEIARRAGVSRPQARSILKAGQQAGFLLALPDGSIAFPDKFEVHMGGLLAAQFISLAWASGEGAAAMGDGGFG